MILQKTKATQGGLNQCVLFDGRNKNQVSTAVRLDKDQIDELLELLPKRANQARRFIKHLGFNPDATTNECNVAVLSVNLSDLAVKYNPYLASAGYKLRCRLPQRLIRNRLGEQTMIHYWGLYKLGGSYA
jgi:hypothetical protein